MKSSEIIDSGLDWITVIGQDENGQNRILQDATDWLEELANRHNPRDWGMAGFKGVSVGPLRVGTSSTDDRFMVIVSGAESNRVIGKLPALKLLKASRVDYQVTVKSHQNLLVEIYNRLKLENLDRKRPRYLHFHESNTGQTLYIGKRTSPIMLRIYDKSGDYPDLRQTAWRFEVEYKKNCAQPAWIQYLYSPNRSKTIIDTVQSELKKRSVVSVRFSEVVNLGIKAEENISDNEKSLAWLKNSVRPVVARLINAGFRDEIQKLFWLDDDCSTWPDLNAEDK